jgi:hypothetical protein
VFVSSVSSPLLFFLLHHQCLSLEVSLTLVLPLGGILTTLVSILVSTGSSV